MALAERLTVKRRSEGSRSNSQSSVEAESNPCDRLSAKSDPCQSPMSLAQIISSTYKHLPNLLIPHPAFLKLLKTVGAKGERFVRDTEIYTIQQLCFYLKEYIKLRQLYDVNDVQVVYCKGDPLGEVFHVDRFTIYEVLDLISKTSTPLLLSPSKNKISISSDSKSIDPQKVKQVGTWKCLDDSAGATTAGRTEIPGVESSPKKSASSVNLSRLFCRHGARSNELLCNFVTSTTDSVRSNTGQTKRSLDEELDGEHLPEKRLCVDKSSAEVREHVFDSEQRQLEKEAQEQQSLLRIGDNSALSGDVSDVESIYSIQSKETAVVKDSSDDLWFLKDDDDVDRDTDDYSDIYADEYDVVSDISYGSSSGVDDDDFDDNDVFAEQEDVIVIYDGSETDFADGELSDIEEETGTSQFSGAMERTSWQCIKCCHRNHAPDRLCDECLNLRTEELNGGETSSTPGSRKHETPSLTSPIRDLSPTDPPTTAARVSDYPFLPSSETDFRAMGSTGETSDSSPQFTSSSQESGFYSGDLEDVGTPPTALRGPSTVERETIGSNETRAQNRKPASISLNLCIICLSEPKVASLIHGTSGHQACCYQCALQLKRMHKPCPVCRRPIQKVIRNYDV